VGISRCPVRRRPGLGGETAREPGRHSFGGGVRRGSIQSPLAKITRGGGNVMGAPDVPEAAPGSKRPGEATLERWVHKKNSFTGHEERRARERGRAFFCDKTRGKKGGEFEDQTDSSFADI